MKTIILLLLFVFNSTLWATETPMNDNFILRAGFSFNLAQMKTDRLIDNHETEDNEPEDETKTPGFGIATSVAYRWNHWEFAFASDAVFGAFKDITFIYQNNSIRGQGNTRLVSIGPQIKYYTPYSIFNRANFYIGFGPSWSLQTFVFRNAATAGNFNNKRRISFENYGGGIFIGLEEILPFKEDHPIFLEVGYSYMHSYKVSVLDATNTAEVTTLSEGDSNEFSAHYIIVRAGFTLF